MHVLRDAESVRDFLIATADAELHGLISGRIEDLAEYTDDGMALGELVNFIVMDAADQVAQLDGPLGFAVLANRFDGHAYGSTRFSPSWDDLMDHPGWFELVYVISDDGFGLVVFIPKGCIDADLIAMCSVYARATQEATDP